MSLLTSILVLRDWSAVQTGLVASLSYWLEWRAVKRLYTGVNAVVTGVGTHVFLVLIENLPHLLL